MEFPTGFKIIKEMTKAELIKEILDNQEVQLKHMELIQLRSTVADFRIAEMTKRINKEAGIKVTRGFLSSGVELDDESD